MRKFLYINTIVQKHVLSFLSSSVIRCNLSALFDDLRIIVFLMYLSWQMLFNLLIAAVLLIHVDIRNFLHLPDLILLYIKYADQFSG